MLYLRFVRHHTKHLVGMALVAIVSWLILSGLPAAASSPASAQPRGVSASASDLQPELVTNNYRQTNLVSDLPGFAQMQDPLLVNPWGFTSSATSPFWTANNGTSTATLYGGDVGGSPFTKNPLNVNINGNLPTGVVFSGSATDFTFTAGGSTGPARFIFASITGNITVWKGGLTTAPVAFGIPDSVYTGLAIGNNGTANFLYAADFAHRKIEVIDRNFHLTTLAGLFKDPALPSDYAPFNIQNLGGKLYVAYAKVDPVTHEDMPGPGNGYVTVFDTNGNLLGRLVSNGPLNSPWGMTIAPAGFGAFPGALLVGNFGDGRINAFNSTTGAFLGTLNDEAGNPIEIEKLWALNFGNGVGGGDTGTLYFSAGYDDEMHGLFGSLKPSSPATTTIQFSAANYPVNEGDQKADITVTRSGDLTVSSTVNYTTFDGTAEQGKDYILAAGTLNFASGEASKSFTILISNDNYVESSETIMLALSNPTGAALGSPNETMVTIQDNDAASPIPVPKTFLANLNGAQEVPPTASTGTGLGAVILSEDEMTAKVVLSFTGLTSNANAAHIHGPAAPGVNAAVLFPLTIAAGSTTSGSTTETTISLTPTQVQQLKSGLFYFNVHTVNNSGGEIRGQIRATTTFVASLNGAQEVPAQAVNGRGTGIVLLSSDETTALASLYFTGLTSNAAAAHIHGPASPGMNAPVLFPFAGIPAATSGSVNNIAISLSPTQVQQLKDGLFYFNVHTSNNPGGEIRGQILFNPVDGSDFFVRENYYDFLNRFPDTSGLAFWTNEIGKCGADTRCVTNRRTDVSAAFFFSTEFQQTGFFVYSVRRAALGTQPNYGQYVIDKTLLGPGTEANKTAFAEAFVQRPEFLAKYPPSQNGSDFIDALIATVQANSGVNLTPRRPELVNEYLLGATQVQSRARVIRKAIQYTEFINAEFNPAFVLSEYYGYLRRNPDPGGYAFWLGQLNANGSNFRAMVCAFVNSGEYQLRFGPTVTRNDRECADLQ